MLPILAYLKRYTAKMHLVRKIRNPRQYTIEMANLKISWQNWVQEFLDILLQTRPNFARKYFLKAELFIFEYWWQKYLLPVQCKLLQSEVTLCWSLVVRFGGG